jgi:RIO kinase 1
VTRNPALWDADLDDYSDLLPASIANRVARPRRSSGPAKSARPSAATPSVEEGDEAVLGGDEFATTYKPARFERAWLRDSLAPFFIQDLVSDVLAQVKGGKEANVYRCQAHPATGRDSLAAKVYRPKRFRNLSNDALYREGRSVIGADGFRIKHTDSRVARALSKQRKSAFGQTIKHATWLMHEYGVLSTLYAAGAPVPEPLAASENAILMSYHGDGELAAPTLNTISLDRDEAQRLFAEVMRGVETMLAQDLIHGDLSAYNILYWEDAITIIDFPQAVNCHVNPYAYPILERDITRVCEYFAQQGVDCDSPRALTRSLWERVVQVNPDEAAVELP